MILKTALDDYSVAILSRLKVRLTRILAEEETVAARNLRAIVENEFQGMVCKLGTTILAEKLPPDRVIRPVSVVFHFPATPWQLFKHQHRHSRWLGWLARTWPVRTFPATKTATLSVELQKYFAYPKAKNLPPEYGDPVRCHDIVVHTGQSVDWKNIES